MPPTNSSGALTSRLVLANAGTSTRVAPIAPNAATCTRALTWPRRSRRSASVPPVRMPTAEPTPSTAARPPAAAGPRWCTRLKYSTPQNDSPLSSSCDTVKNIVPNHIVGIRSSARSAPSWPVDGSWSGARRGGGRWMSPLAARSAASGPSSATADPAAAVATVASKAASCLPRAGSGRNTYQAATSRPIGTQIQNAHCQPPSCSATPPPTSPTNAPTIAPAW